MRSYFLFILGLLAAVASVQASNSCPCTTACFDSGVSKCNGVYNDTQISTCRSGFKCAMQNNSDCVYGAPVIECQSVCNYVSCPCGETCQLYNVGYTKKKFVYNYNVPLCGNATQPANPCDTTDCGNGVCQLSLVEGSCKKDGEPCKAKAYCSYPCKSSICNCPKGTYCQGTYEDCDLGPCSPTYICTNPCDGYVCPTGYKCTVVPEKCTKKPSYYCTRPYAKCTSTC